MVQKLWLRNTEKCMLFNACDLNFYPVTLVLKLDLDIMVTYFYTKIGVKRSFGSKIIVWKRTDTQAYMCKTLTYPLSPAINMAITCVFRINTYKSV